MNLLVICGSILGAGFLLCLILILYFKHKSTTSKHNIDEYAGFRKQLTLRKKKEPEPEVESSSGFETMQQIFIAIITIAIILAVGLLCLQAMSSSIEGTGIVNSTSSVYQSQMIVSNVTESTSVFIGDSGVPGIIGIAVSMLIAIPILFFAFNLIRSPDVL